MRYNEKMEKYDKSGDKSYALGTTLTFELLNRKSDKATRIYISPKQKRDETYLKLVNLAKSKNIPIIENNEKIFKSLSGKDNTMVIGEFKKFQGKMNKGNHIVLVNPSNMGNLGTILRSSAAFGIDGVYIIKPAADIFDPKCVRGSMGSIFSIEFKYFSSFNEYLFEAGNDRDFYPFMLQTNNSLKDIKEVKTPFTLIFGNEATGLDDSFLKVGTPLKIPQSSVVDSLNLDNAVSIALYHFLAK